MALIMYSGKIESLIKDAEEMQKEIVRRKKNICRAEKEPTSDSLAWRRKLIERRMDLTNLCLLLHDQLTFMEKTREELDYERLFFNFGSTVQEIKRNLKVKMEIGESLEDVTSKVMEKFV